MIPIDVISGFLGAGKTTLAGLILKYYIERGEKPVYIVNEFGEAALDADIIRHDGFEAVEMVGGCVCCTLKDNAVITIKRIVATFSPTRIVFEPSGVFMPDAFFDILKDDYLSARCRRGSIITVVDSLSLAKARIKAGSFVSSQIRHADRLILSKLEKSGADVAELICDLKNLNPKADLFAKRWDLLGREDFERLTEPENDSRGHEGGHHHFHHTFEALTVNTEKSFDGDSLDRLCALLRGGTLGEICRVKGVIRREGKPALLNIAFEDVNIGPSELEDFALTFIGNGMDKDQIVKALNSL